MWWSRKRDPATYEAPPGIPGPDTLRTLLLYKFDACPFCIRVFRALENCDIEVPMADTRHSREDRDALLALTGRTQVPCLMIDGVPLLESQDIIDWLDAYALRGAASAS